VTDVDERAPDLSEPPPFDPRHVRRAVWRGVLRTAFVAVGWLLGALIVLQVASGVWSGRGRDRFAEVVRYGFSVAHPEYDALSGGCCNADIRFGATIFLYPVPRTATSESPSSEVLLRRDFRGRIAFQGQRPQSESTPVMRALGLGRSELKATERLLAELPRPVSVTAVIEFAQPADQAAFDAFAGRHPQPLTFMVPILVSPVYYGDPVIHGQPDPAVPFPPLSWPEPSIAGFQRWAAMLRPSDDPNLAELGLPSATGIQRIAGSARIHGFITRPLSIDELLELLHDPAVRSVNVADVAFDLDPTHVEQRQG
jgi:hypothetical protein